MDQGWALVSRGQASRGVSIHLMDGGVGQDRRKEPVELLSDPTRSWAALVLNHQLSAPWQNNGAGSPASSSGTSPLDTASSIVSGNPRLCAPSWRLGPKGPRGCSWFGFAFWSGKLANTVDPGTAERPCFLLVIRSGCQVESFTGGYDDSEVSGER